MTTRLPALVVAGDEELRERLCAALEVRVPLSLAVRPAAAADPELAREHAAVVLAGDAVRQVAALRAGRPDLAIVVVTEPGDAATAAHALEAGADDAVPADAIAGDAFVRRVGLAVRRRSRRATAAFENAIDAMFILDDDRNVVTANLAAAALLGMPPADLVGRSAAEFISAVEYRDIVPVWRRALESNRPDDREFSVLRADGQRIPVEATVSPSVSPGRHLVMVRDLSARRAAEADAERARQELQAVVDGVPSYVFIKDRHLRYRLINELMERHLQAEPGDLIGRTDEEILAAEDIATVRANDLHVLETGETIVAEEHLGPPDNRRTMLVQKFPLHGEQGEIVGVCGVATDITERQRLHERVRRSADQHAAVAELGRRALIGAPLQDLLDEAAARVATVLGTDLSEILELSGGPESDLMMRAGVGWEGHAASLGHVPGGGRHSLAGYVVASDAAVSMEDARTETRFDASGLIAELDVVSGLAVPIRSADGVYGVIGVLSRQPRRFEPDEGAFLEAIANVVAAAIARDSAAELRRRLEQSQRLEALGQLAGGIAHDFNNLLAVILSHADFALEDLPEDSPVRPDVENVRSAAQRAAELTRRLLTLGRGAQAGDAGVDIAAIVRDMEGLLRRTIGAHVEMVVETGNDPLPCLSAAGQIEQIVLNLVTNARDAMPTGGRLVLRADAVLVEDGFPVTGRALEAGAYARITVADSGAGMAPDVVARAFDPFFTTKAAGQGTGLGLSTVHSVAAQLGGGVQIVSHPGTGTTVNVYLPLTEAPTTIAPARPEPAPREGRGERVLVVEDEDGVRRLVSRVLERAGYEVIEARDGAAGLRVAASVDARIDLLLTDVVMPQLSGPQLAEQVRRMNPDAAVLFMSGYTPRMLAAQMQGDARAPVLQKPFTATDLLEAVAEQLGRRRN